MARADTVTRILDSAELLFAQQGFAETSLRAITSRAGVNLASVNYHFGSKDALIQAVFARFLTPFCQALDGKLASWPEGPQGANLNALLQMCARLAIGPAAGSRQRATLFFRLCGQAYSQPQGHLRRYLDQHYGQVLQRFLAQLRRAVPDVPAATLFWRVQFGLGAVIFALSGLESLQAISQADFGQALSAAQLSDYLLPFLIGGIEAKV